MAEVAAVMRDPARIEAIARCAFEEIALNPRHSFAHAVHEADAAIDRVVRPEMLSTAAPYSPEEFARAAAPGYTTRLRRAQRALRTFVHRLIFATLLGHASAARRERIERRLRQIRGLLSSGKRASRGA